LQTFRQHFYFVGGFALEYGRSFYQINFARRIFRQRGTLAFCRNNGCDFTYRKGLKLDVFTFLTSLLYAGTLSCFVYATKTQPPPTLIFLQYTARFIFDSRAVYLKEKFRASDLLTVIICLAGMSLFFLEPQNAENTLLQTYF
jgi:EamA domain-containing membrane protein RarD